MDYRLTNLLKHIDGVRANCVRLATRLAERGETELAHQLIIRGYCHDESKFYGIEFEYLNDNCWPSKFVGEDKVLFEKALAQHITTNSHHPQFKGFERGIHSMSRLDLAEFVCDICARSKEQGTEVADWIRSSAIYKFEFGIFDDVFFTIADYVLLLTGKSL